MKSIKTISVSMPIEMSKKIQKMAKDEHRTISEFVREAIRQYSSQKNFKLLVKEGMASAKKRNLTQEDFGGPFED